MLGIINLLVQAYCHSEPAKGGENLLRMGSFVANASQDDRLRYRMTGKRRHSEPAKGG